MSSRVIPSLLALALPVLSHGQSAVLFLHAEASWEQLIDGPWLAAETIDGITSASDGWAIAHAYDAPQWIEWSLGNTDAPGLLTLNLLYRFGNAHVLEDYSLSYKATPEAAWTLITDYVELSASNPSTSITNDAGHLLFDGIGSTETQTLSMTLPSAFSLRLDTGVLPGRVSHGNFVLTEITGTFTPIPEPATLAALLGGAAAALVVARRRHRKA